jgi:hypothetical protein
MTMTPHDEISPNPRPGSMHDGASTPALKEEASDLIIVRRRQGLWSAVLTAPG